MESSDTTTLLSNNAAMLQGMQAQTQKMYNFLDEVTSNFQERLDSEVSRVSQAKSEKLAAEKKEKAIPKHEPTPWREQTVGKSYTQDELKERGKPQDKGPDARASAALGGKNAAPEEQRQTAAVTESAGDGSEGEGEDTLASLEPLLVDSEESDKVLSGLKQFSQLSTIQSPNLNTVSQRLLSLVQGLDNKAGKAGDTGKAVSGAGNVESLDSTKKAKGKSGPESNKPSEYYDRIQKLKDKVMKQVRFHLRMAVKNGVGKVDIQLRPEYLGNVKIQLMMDSAQANASFIVDNNSVKSLIDDNLDGLRDALAERGTYLDEVDVQVADDGEGEQENGRAFSSFEDRQAMKQWINSFYNYDEDKAVAIPVEEEDEGGGEIIVDSEEEEALNIIA